MFCPGEEAGETKQTCGGSLQIVLGGINKKASQSRGWTFGRVHFFCGNRLPHVEMQEGSQKASEGQRGQAGRLFTHILTFLI